MRCEYKNNALEIKNHQRSTEFINVLRRYCMNKVPIIAPKYLEILRNETGFCDEYIAHRIAMIPFKNTDKEDGIMTLSKKNNSDENITLYSGDLKGDYEVVYDNIPIIVLTPGDEINLEIYFEKNNGIKHAKFKPCYAYFKVLGENNVVLFIEPYGQMETKEIINSSLDQIEEELKEIYKFISE